MPPKRDPEATQAAIIEAAEEIFVKKGFSATSMSEIANQAKVTKSLLHHHFGSKDALWREVKMRRFSSYLADEQARLLDRENEEPEIGVFARSVEAYFRFLKQNQQIVRMVAWMFLEEDEECLSGEKPVFDIGVARIKEAQDAGRFRNDVDPRNVVVTLMALSHYWFQSRHHLCEHHFREAVCDERDESYLTDITKILMDGLEPK